MEHKDLVSILIKHAQLTPARDAYCFISGEQHTQKTVSYQQLDHSARVIGAQLRQTLNKGDRALLMFHSGIEFIEAFFACLYAGVIAVPVYPPKKNQKIERLQSIIEDADASVVLTTAVIYQRCQPMFEADPRLKTLSLLVTDIISKDSHAAVLEQVQINSEDIAFLQYTSGSTGDPKGVIIDHQNMINNEMLIQKSCGHNINSKMVSWLPHFHDMGLIFGVLQPIFIGVTGVLMSPEFFIQKPIRWLKVLSEFKGTTSGGPNFAYDLCIDTIKDEELSGLDLSHWQVAFNGAEPVRAETMARFSEKFARCGFSANAFFPCYGMAETTLIATGAHFKTKPLVLSIDGESLTQGRAVIASETNIDSVIAAVSSGYAWLEHQVKVVDPSSCQLCADSHVGEIWIKGDSVAKGYWNRPDINQEVFNATILGNDGDSDGVQGGFLRTGDLGFMQKNELFVTGRAKDLLVFRGRNHYPQDIELTTEKAHKALKINGGSAFSTDINNVERLIIVQEVNRTAIRSLNPKEIFTSIVQQVVDVHEITPFDIVLIKPGRVLKTSSGKIQRQGNKQAYLSEQFEVLARYHTTSCNDEINTNLKSTAPAVLTPQKGSSNEPLAIIKDIIARATSLSASEVDIDMAFQAMGIDSMLTVQLSAALESHIGIELSDTVFYDHPSIRLLSQYIGTRLSPTDEVCADHASTENAADHGDIAVIGMACHYPGAKNIGEFWRLLSEGQDAITALPPSRAHLGDAIASERRSGYLDNIDFFDAGFFGISPKEAKSMDPQQRLLLQNSYHAIESSGYSAQALAGKNVGVFVGISQSDYMQICQNHARQSGEENAYLGSGNALSIVANRLSYFYDFKGPSLAIDTACSSSLVALHYAVKSLQSREVPLAMVCGVNLILNDTVTRTFEQAGMLAADGRCKTFSDDADGYVRGEGVATLLLKPLQQAIADQDMIQGVIKGSAIGQDGRSNGITAPNGTAQQQVIQAALSNAGVKPQQVDYVEAHGTGTELGDPIELSALDQVYGHQRDNPLLVGSVKANIGHLESAAGIAGVIKTLLCLQHQKIPQQVHFDQPNRHIPWDKLALCIPRKLCDWPQQRNQALAGVSSFGFGGTNAHVICARAPQLDNSRQSQNHPARSHLLTLSAKSDQALVKKLVQYQELITSHPQIDLSLLCYSGNATRGDFSKRCAFSAENSLAMGEQIQSRLTQLQSRSQPVHMSARSAKQQDLVFMFTGQGAQYPLMAYELYQAESVFQQAMKRCDDILSSQLEHSILTVLYSPEHAHLLERTDYTQVALFSVQYSLVQLWAYWGIKPQLVLGHSVGEYVAACVAGVFSVQDALSLLATRGKLMQQLEAKGKMIAVRATADVVEPMLTEFSTLVSVAAYHGVSGVVVSGETEVVAKIAADLKALSYQVTSLDTARAFHSPLMEPVLQEFSKAAHNIQYHCPALAMVSSVTGQKITEEIATAEYWIRQICQPVLFESCISTLATGQYIHFVEIGTKATLTAIVQQNMKDPACHYVPSISRKGEELSQIHRSLGRLYEAGFDIDWHHFYQGKMMNKIPLPEYPFDSDSHWLSVNTTGALAGNGTDEADVVAVSSTVHNQISDFILTTIATLMETSSDSIRMDLPLLEMGVDSLMLSQAVRKFEHRFGLEFTIRQFYEDLTTIDALVAYVALHSEHIETAQNNPLPVAQPIAVAHSNNLAISSLPEVIAGQDQQMILALCQQQLAMVSQTMNAVVEQQLVFVKNQAAEPVLSKQAVPTGGGVATNGQAVVKEASLIWQPKEFTATKVSDKQQQHLDQLIVEQNKKNVTSKNMTAQYRHTLADNRASAGFRLSTKEMLFPLFSDRAQGSHIWDVDGNEYVDLTMDFGVNLFGHRSPFIVDAITKQANTSMQLGLTSPLAGKVAELICELTGMARVAFCNSGTEAVMTALRLARTKTGRSKVVHFSGSYHGHFDGTLGQADVEGVSAVPFCSGVSTSALNDSMVLEYAHEQTLQTIRDHAHEIAAVLVEPVQSRRPDHQPWAFLQQLRQLTQEHGIALIFDEIITGFRVHPGGIQALLDIKADITTYGKVVGGGLPIGIVAGSDDYLDGIDGGTWQYGDSSYPQQETTFFAGTFCKNPLTMAAAHAVLSEIKRRGPELQNTLTEKTEQLVRQLDQFYAEHDIPIKMVYFSSLFRFSFRQNMDLLFYHLQKNGVYIWEGRNCFLSDAHSEQDITQIVEAVKQSCLALKAAGYFERTVGVAKVIDRDVPVKAQSIICCDGEAEQFDDASMREIEL
jgi:acyl transferase domain-containing protein/acyl-CoA synthetase (AMP-forming)/AMP-acid ligase II